MTPWRTDKASRDKWRLCCQPAVKTRRMQRTVGARLGMHNTASGWPRSRVRARQAETAKRDRQKSAIVQRSDTKGGQHTPRTGEENTQRSLATLNEAERQPPCGRRNTERRNGSGLLERASVATTPLTPWHRLTLYLSPTRLAQRRPNLCLRH